MVIHVGKSFSPSFHWQKIDRDRCKICRSSFKIFFFFLKREKWRRHVDVSVHVCQRGFPWYTAGRVRNNHRQNKTKTKNKEDVIKVVMLWGTVLICRVTYLSTCPTTMTFATCLSTNDRSGEGGKLALWDLKTMKMEVTHKTLSRFIPSAGVKELIHLSGDSTSPCYVI